MKTPLYETSAGALRALMFNNSVEVGQFVYCDLYSFTLASGGTLRYTTADQDVGYVQNGIFTTWSSKSVRFDYEQSKAVAHYKVGLDVDTWQVVVFPRPMDDVTGASYPDTIGSLPWLSAVTGGALDAAITTVDRAYFSSWPSLSGKAIVPTGVLPIFAGKVAEVDVSRTAAIININSHMELLTQTMPRNVYSSMCRHTLFDPGCRLVAASYQVGGIAQPGSTNLQILSPISAPPNTPGTFTLGRLYMTSGQNAGYARAIRSWTPGTFNLISRLPFAIAPGDDFVAWPGCDKTSIACALFGAGTPSGIVAPSPPVLTETTGGVTAKTQYTAIITYVGGAGESGPSTETVFNVDVGFQLVVHSPAAATGITGWNAYVSNVSGLETLQNNSPIPIGTNYTVAVSPVNGRTPPRGLSITGNTENFGGEPYIPIPETAG